jgi:hypothetical protein
VVRGRGQDLAIDAAIQRLHRQKAPGGRRPNGVSAFVGLDGFVVTGQLLDEATGEWWLAVETSSVVSRLWRAGNGPRPP